VVGGRTDGVLADGFGWGGDGFLRRLGPYSIAGVGLGSLMTHPPALQSLGDGANGGCEVWHGRLYVHVKLEASADWSTVPATWECAVPGHDGPVAIEMPQRAE
jgi:hypothetical protein